jgi:heme exporter protein C
MRQLLRWLLWLWISTAIVAAFLWAPRAQDFLGESSRILFFHVPMAWAAFVGFMVAGGWSIGYLWRRRPDHDRAATAAVELGLLFGVLATVSGAIWARIEWGAYWNWDPRQTTIVLALLFYAAYLALRSAIADHETRRRQAAGYAVLGLVVAPFLFFIAPRIAAFSLHPEPVVNAEGEVAMDPAVLIVMLAGSAGFTALFYWMLSLQRRIALLAHRNGAEL